MSSSTAPRSLQSVTSIPVSNARRCYSIAQVCAVLQISRSTFHALRRTGRLPMLEELQPRLGRNVRYRADLVDKYLAGQWGQPRSFSSHRRVAS